MGGDENCTLKNPLTCIVRCPNVDLRDSAHFGRASITAELAFSSVTLWSSRSSQSSLVCSSVSRASMRRV